MHKLVQHFPLRHRVTGRLEGFCEFLHAPFHVGERPAFLGMRAARQQIVGLFCRGVGQDVADDQQLQLAKQRGVDAVLRDILAENDQRRDFAGRDPLGDGSKPRADALGRDSGELRAGGVRVAIAGDEQVIGLTLARYGVGQRLVALGQFVQQKKLLVGLPRRRDDRDRAFGGLGQVPGNLLQRAWPSDVALWPAQLGQAIVTADPLVVEPTGVAHPVAVHRVISARLVAVHLVFARADDRVATGAAAGAEALGFLEEPDAHLKAEVVRRQRADRADVDGVERVVVVERLAGISRDRVVTASVHDAQSVVAGDVGSEADTTGTHHAALGVERDPRA